MHRSRNLLDKQYARNIIIRIELANSNAWGMQGNAEGSK